ncbi:NADH:flavin oxidoreductase/NADH oxidase [Loktanella sp. SALINAS62]|uniref:NADH:flavin oxidoreductase/NADH oxidase n=1 Tax=Loktanella sp. SALINAS62 TaxID=2706124 RepID=UPI001B8CCBE0|nr:NADH:flavin oxidoreductase/NADH oxidase [Loktanella sp. SALINAS62]MBS1301484.1 NADH:flavin oxidoreductase/NADH oxidase [Loktanella sp. SALINAS62]
MTSHLFSPFDLGGVTVPNRIVVAPMCQYSAKDGVPGAWHQAHLGQFAMSGSGLIIVEATGVEPDGRITPHCPGLYDDATEAAFAAIVSFMKSVGDSRIGIQLSHAGRKGSTASPWDGGGLIEGAEGWTPIAPSAMPYLPDWPAPQAMDADAMTRVKDAFANAARRAARIGFDVVQLHAAHGYLLHQFLSPITNTRTDEYGGSLENRIRFPLEVFAAVREACPDDLPIVVRLSAIDWIDGGWDMEGSIKFSKALKALGCAAMDVSSGGLDQRQSIVTGPGYQVRFAETLRREADMPVMAVGQITDPIQAETIVATGQADFVALARGMLWDPRWPWKAAVALGAEISLPAPYSRCNPALAAKPFVTRT